MKILFLGDIFLYKEYKNKIFIGEELKQLFEKHDFICCNLEGPLTLRTEKSPKRGPSLKQGEDVLNKLVNNGINFFNLANNHIMDYGIGGLGDTVKAIKKNCRLHYMGAAISQEDVYTVKKINCEGKVIGFISLAECAFGASVDEEGGFAWMGHEKVLHMFEEAQKECDYFFVICHCGAEELNVPLPEVKSLYRFFIDLGAEAVIGHHPHVIQGCEEYKEKKIYYSLGNFAFDSMEIGKDVYMPNGLIVSLEISEKAMETTPILTEYIDGQVEIKRDGKEWLDVNKALHDKKIYKSRVDSYCIDLYKGAFRDYYAAVLGLDLHNRDNIEKFAEHRLQGDELNWDDLFLYHNIAVETNRWICVNAIKSMTKNFDKLILK